MGSALKERYQIEDLVSQDETGAVYCARDTRTGKLVALRRFFPLGISGGGFEEDERAGFSVTVEVLKRVRHGALRGVIDGGVDEVDGMPYLVMEWVEGKNLSELLEDGPLDAERGVLLASRGLELLSLLESQFGKDSQWVEMEADTVVVSEDEGLFTFWICPFQWLGVAERDGGLRGLGYLVEHAMGWEEQLVPPAAAAGLGGWVAAAKRGKWSLAEASRELVRVRSLWTGETVETVLPPEGEIGSTTAPGRDGAPVAANVRRGTSPGPASRSGSPGLLWSVLGGMVAILLMVGIGWALRSGREKALRHSAAQGDGEANVASVVRLEPAPKPGSREEALTRQERINRQVRKATEAMKLSEGEGGEAEEIREQGPSRLTVFGPEDGEELRDWAGATVTLQGRLFRVRDSNSGKTRYLEFSDQTGKNDVCCRFWARGREDLRLEDLKKLEGKVLRCFGLVRLEQGTGRVVIHLDQPDQIAVVGE